MREALRKTLVFKLRIVGPEGLTETQAHLSLSLSHTHTHTLPLQETKEQHFCPLRNFLLSVFFFHSSFLPPDKLINARLMAVCSQVSNHTHTHTHTHLTKTLSLSLSHTHTQTHNDRTNNSQQADIDSIEQTS